MKIIKLLIISIILLPVIVKAETIYTEYKSYITESENRISESDLIKEEIIPYYLHEKINILEGEYYKLNDNPSKHPFIDEDKYIISKRSISRFSNANYFNARILKFKTDIVKTIAIISDEEVIINLYDLNMNKLNYEKKNNIYKLTDVITSNNLIITFEFEGTAEVKILINDTAFSFNLENKIEITFAEKVYEFLIDLGIITMYDYVYYDFYVSYTTKYYYYNAKVETIIDKDNSYEYKKVINKYNYYIRDKVDFKNSLVLSKEKNNVFEYINESTIPISDIKYEGNIDFDTNGVYEIHFIIDDKMISKNIFVLNEKECPMGECKSCTNDIASICPFNYEIKSTCEQDIIYVEYPVIYEKEITKFKTININKSCSTNTSKKSSNTELKESGLILFPIILGITYASFKKKRMDSFVEIVSNAE